MSTLVFDLSQEGLLCVLRPWQIAVMHCFWDKKEPLVSRAVHDYLQDIGGEAAISRASVIKFLDRMVNEDFFDYIEETCKGGTRKVYRLNAMSKTERVFRNQITLKFNDRLRTFWKSEEET